MSAKEKVKLNPAHLSPDVSARDDRAARAMAIIAAALMEAANALLGKPSRMPGNLLGSGPQGCILTVNELINEFLLAKARAGRGDRYLRELRQVLKNFNGANGSLPLDQVQVTDLERWIQNTSWSNRTVRGYLADVRTMFNFAVKRGYVGRNPVAGIELPVQEGEGTIWIHRPDQVKQVLETARRSDLDVCRRLAIRYFAGVRSAEANRLTEADLKFDHGLIEVPALKSKTRSRRLVTIQPNLKAWLELGGELRGIADKTILRTVRLSRVEWHKNVTRHSFVSYHLEQFQNAGKTALEAGHSEAMLFKHYRALVTPDQATEFWGIIPSP